MINPSYARLLYRVALFLRRYTPGRYGSFGFYPLGWNYFLVVRVSERSFAAGALVCPPRAGNLTRIQANLSLLLSYPLNYAIFARHERLKGPISLPPGVGVVEYDLRGKLRLFKEPEFREVPKVAIRETWMELFEEIEIDKFLERY